CCSAVRSSDVPDRIPAPRKSEWINPGDSLIVNPDGKIVAGPLHEATGILYGEIDPTNFSGPRWQLDVAGHYARPDVFTLTVHQPKRPIVETRPSGHPERSEGSALTDGRADPSLRSG